MLIIKPTTLLLSITFYDRSGNAVAYSEDDRHMYLFGGEPIGYLDAEAFFSYRGELIGWFENGWLRDKDGRCIAYSDQAAGGPPQPVKLRRPNQSIKQTLPVLERQDPRPLRPMHSNAWSTQSAVEFFSRIPHSWPGGLGDSHQR